MTNRRLFRICLGLILSTMALALVGCPRVSPDEVEGVGVCSTHVQGVTTGQAVGALKLYNEEQDKNADYDLIVPEALLQRYEFQLDGQPLNFQSIGNGMARFRGAIEDAAFSSSMTAITPPGGDPRDNDGSVCIDVVLKEDLMEDVVDQVRVIFFDDNEQLKEQMLDIEIASRPGDRYVAAIALFELFGVDPMFLARSLGLPFDKFIRGSALVQGEQIPEGPLQIIGRLLPFFGIPAVKALEGFPCGQGENGFTVCPASGSDLDEPMPAEYAMVGSVVDANIPLEDPANFYTYAFVFDTDDNPGNNWVADPAFPNDFFQDTDRWYEVQYAPDTGWVLVASQVQADGSVMRDIPTAANAVIRQNVVALIVPKSEIGMNDDGVISGVRHTSFRHTGDFGLNPPYEYNADVEPPVDVGLYGY